MNLPQGYGKTTIANELAQKLGCAEVVDDWLPNDPLTPGALHLTCCDLESKPQQAPAQSLGNIPTLLPGEHYAGILLDEKGTPTHHLVLLTATQDTRLTWQAAMDWAASVGGALPTRQEQALLYTNCKPHLQHAWHWSCQEDEDDASHVWDCHFVTGSHSTSLKSYEGSVVAVRRLTINPSIL